MTISPVCKSAAKLGLLALAVLTALVLAVPQATARTRHTTTSAMINHHTIRLGSSARISGRVSPNLYKHAVYLQRKTGRHWHTVTHRKLGKKSRYAFAVRPGKAGTYRYRVYEPKSKGHTKSYSKTLRLTVRRAANCTAGYRPCIAPGSDVDCYGGSGNGPRYVRGPVYVTGSDPYRLDADHDGVACER